MAPSKSSLAGLYGSASETNITLENILRLYAVWAHEGEIAPEDVEGHEIFALFLAPPEEMRLPLRSYLHSVRDALPRLDESEESESEIINAVMTLCMPGMLETKYAVKYAKLAALRVRARKYAIGAFLDELARYFHAREAALAAADAALAYILETDRVLTDKIYLLTTDEQAATQEIRDELQRARDELHAALDALEGARLPNPARLSEIRRRAEREKIKIRAIKRGIEHLPPAALREWWESRREDILETETALAVPAHAHAHNIVHAAAAGAWRYLTGTGAAEEEAV